MDLKEARQTAKAITAATGWDIKAYQADVTDEAQVDGVVDAIVRFIVRTHSAGTRLSLPGIRTAGDGHDPHVSRVMKVTAPHYTRYSHP